MNPPKIVVVLESRNWQEIREHQDLAHDGGQLLKWMIERLSIPRDRWVHTYAFASHKDRLPGTVKARRDLLEPHAKALEAFFKTHYPCSVLAMGKIAIEMLIGKSQPNKCIGAEWDTKFRFEHIGIEKIWITYLPDAALFAPDLAVPISRMIVCAAREAGLEPVINYNLPVFRNWFKYY